MGDPPLHAFHRRVVFAAIVVHVIAAWFSSGYYAADEHYQVIVFAQHKLGELSAEELPWEYEARIRSAILPGIAYTVIGASRSLIATEPLLIAFFLRLLTALFALVVVRSFVQAMMHRITDAMRSPYVVLSYFLWFLPYQHVRFAGETWSALLFLLGLAHLLGNGGNRWNMLATGLLFGLSLQLKPVMIVACAGAIAWDVFANKERRAPRLPLLAGLVVALITGFVVDRWYYGEYTPTLWNYIHLAVVGDPAHTFEVFPWYYYFPWILKYGIWPIGLLLVGALVWLTFRQPRAWVVWCIWPCLIVLSFIPHKEVRFLFPLVDLAPLLLVLAWQETGDGKFARALKHRAWLIPLIAINACGLVVSSTTAAGSGRTRLVEALWHNSENPTGSIGYAFHDDRIWKARIPSFYLPTGMRDMGYADPCAVARDLPETPITDILVAHESPGSGCTPGSEGYQPVARSESRLATELLDLYNSERSRPFLLYAHETGSSRTSDP